MAYSYDDPYSQKYITDPTQAPYDPTQNVYGTQPVSAPQPYNPSSSPYPTNINQTSPINYAPGTGPILQPGVRPPNLPQVPPGVTAGPGGALNYPSGTASGSSGSVPSYVNMQDPASAAVWQAFQQKGITPRDQGDFQYWVDKINQTGGWGNQDNQNYWLSRMAQANGGVGDYQERPESGSAGAAAGLTQPQDDTFGQAVRSSILGLLNPSPVTDQSPFVSQAEGAYKNASERALGDARNALAERLYAEGGGDVNQGELTTQVGNLYDRMGNAEAQYNANLVNDWNQLYQNQKMQGLGYGMNTMLQGSQLGYNYAALQAELNRQALLAALGG